MPKYNINITRTMDFYQKIEAENEYQANSLAWAGIESIPDDQWDETHIEVDVSEAY